MLQDFLSSQTEAAKGKLIPISAAAQDKIYLTTCLGYNDKMLLIAIPIIIHII